METETQIDSVKFVVRALIKNNLNQVLVLQRPDGRWCLPGGKINPDEQDPILALKREIFEELKLQVVAQNLFKTLEGTVDNKLWHNAYFCTQVEQYEQIELDTRESIQYRWINAISVINYVFAFGNDKVIESFFETIEA